jgi:hypothetical protein
MSEKLIRHREKHMTWAQRNSEAVKRAEEKEKRDRDKRESRKLKAHTQEAEEGSNE